MQKQSKPLVYTVDEISKLLRVSKPSAYEAVNTGKIPSVRVGKRLLVPKDAFDRWLSGQQVAA